CRGDERTTHYRGFSRGPGKSGRSRRFAGGRRGYPLRKTVSLARSLNRAFSFLLMAATLFAAGLAAPKQATAQEPAAAPASDQTDTSLSSAHDRAVEEEKKEIDHYRHASIVEAIGHKLGMDTETTAKVFEAVNFLIIFFAIVIPVV